VTQGLAERSSGSHPPISLVDLLDRLLGTGVVLAGDVVISLSGVDLVQVRLHALISTVRDEMTGMADDSAGEDPDEGRGDGTGSER
jgi:hypothetical protein